MVRPSLDRPWFGGVTGLVKTAAREWPAADVKAIDIATRGRAPDEIADLIFAELYAGGPDDVHDWRALLADDADWRARTRVGHGRHRLGAPRVRSHVFVRSDAGRYVIRERRASIVEVPLGLGGSFEVVRGWLAIQIELTGSVMVSQEGNALERAQAIDASGKRRTVASLPLLDASFTQSVGLSLIL